ncbi:hypothetical protein EN859_032770 [Mesorhizobium sp. M00.F.Ca.ET.216.01.1.1]|nr:hypothetical protein EN859_032770 [Mesorhizobium sp. M00.F.Ca.ET.216.01.1.1]
MTSDYREARPCTVANYREQRRRIAREGSIKFDPEMKKNGAIAASAMSVGMDGSIHAQYGWGCDLARPSIFAASPRQSMKTLVQ